MYLVAFNKFQFFGAEGVAAGLSDDVDFGAYTVKGIIEEGSPCVVQSMEYDPDDPEGSKHISRNDMPAVAKGNLKNVPAVVPEKRKSGSVAVAEPSKKVKAPSQVASSLTVASGKKSAPSSRNAGDVSVFCPKDKSADPMNANSSMLSSDSPLPLFGDIPGILDFPDPPASLPAEQDQEQMEHLRERIKAGEDAIDRWASAMRDVQGKLVMTASALERVHASLSAVVERLHASTTLSLAHLNNPNPTNAEALRSFLVSHSKIARSLVEPINIANRGMNVPNPTRQEFSRTARRRIW